MIRECAKTLKSEMTNAEVSAIKNTLGKTRLSGVHIEIGTAAGGTLCEILKCYQNDLKVEPPKFIVIDPLTYFNNQHETICLNLEKNGLNKDNVCFEKNKSSTAFRNLNVHSGKVDFILIDGNHKVNHFVSDLRFARLLKVGGLLLIHDYSQNFKGIMFFTNRFLRSYSNYEIIARVDSLLILSKRSDSVSAEISYFDRFFSSFCNLFGQIGKSVQKRFL